MSSGRRFLVLAACAAVALASCASTPSASTAPASPPASASSTPQDYLGESIRLVGIPTASWQGDLYTVPFFTAEVLTPASASTKNQALVRPTGKVPDSSETEFWTPYVASSRPAVKEDLEPGALVFAMGDADPRDRETLAKTTQWSLFRVKDVANLSKGTATLEYHDTYWNTWKAYEYHVNNIRIVLGELSTELAE